MKKRMLAMLLCLAQLAAILCGCGSAAQTDSATGSAVSVEESAVTASVSESELSEEPQAEKPAEPSEAPAEAPEEEPAALPTIEYPVGNGDVFTIAVVLDGNLLNFVPDGDPAQASGIKRLQEETGITLDYTVFAMMSDNMTLMISSGEWTDIICKIDESYSSGVAGALEDDVILDLAPYIDEYAPDYAAILASDDSYKKDAYTDNGELGAFFDFRIPSASGNVIRKDWLDEAGIAEIPETYDEFETAALAVLNNHPELTSCYAMGSSFIAQGYESELEYGYGIDTINNGLYIGDDGQVDFSWTADGARNYLAMIARWGELGIVNRDEILTGDSISFGNRIYQGGSLMKHNNTDAFGPDMMSMAEDPNFELVPAYELTVNRGDEIRFGGAGSVSSGWSITTSCSNPELLIQALNWIYTDDGTITFNFGIEGEAYTVDENGSYHYTDLILNNPDGLPQFFATSVYTGFEMPKLAMQEAADAKLVNQAQFDAKDFWNTQKRTAAGTFHGDLTAEELAQSAVYSDINTYVQEKAMAFAIGDLELSDQNWNEFVAQVDAMGIDRVIDCYQAAYDRYLAR